MYSHRAIYHGKLVALKAISYTRLDFFFFFNKGDISSSVMRTRVNHEDKQQGKPFLISTIKLSGNYRIS